MCQRRSFIKKSRIKVLPAKTCLRAMYRRMKQQKIPDTLFTACRFYHHFVDNKNILEWHKFRFHSLLIRKLFQSSSVFSNEVFGPGSDIGRKTLERVFGSGNNYCTCRLVKRDMDGIS